jgi:hypothetical protein
MAAFQFPANPTVGQVYTANNVSFKWNGQGWVPFSAAYQTGADVDARIAAHNADAAAHSAAFTAFGETLVGQIFYRHAAQAKELQCNGQTVSKTTYASLWTYAQAFLTTDQVANPGLFVDVDASNFKVPNLAGQFVRGQGGASGALGAQQAEMIGPHTHAISTPLLQGTGSGTIQSLGGADITVAGTTTNNNAGTENRPANVALIACIRALP